jgi:hypothetical protein
VYTEVQLPPESWFPLTQISPQSSEMVSKPERTGCFEHTARLPLLDESSVSTSSPYAR